MYIIWSVNVAKSQSDQLRLCLHLLHKISATFDDKFMMHMKMNNINGQWNAKITILLIFESAQHVSGNLLTIFRSVRLWLQQCGVLSNVVVGRRSGVRRRRLCVRCEGCCSSNIPHTEHVVYASADQIL